MSGKTSFDTAEDRYRILLESTPLVPWEADARTWLFTYVGPQAADLLGYPVEDWYGDTFWVDRIHPDDRDATVSTCVRLSREDNDYELEYRMIRADGTIAWIHDVVSVEMENGEPALLRGFLIDVTTGPGFQAGLDDIFEPFVTTKANGLGMGLSISRSIIDAHGGRLEAVHDPDGGATLHITLPAGGEDS